MQSPVLWCSLLLIVGIPIFILVLKRYPSLMGIKADRFPEPPGNWTRAGDNVQLRDLKGFRGDPAHSRRRTISPSGAQLGAATLWTREINGAACYFFYGKSNPMLHTPYRLLPILIVHDLDEVRYDLVISNRAVYGMSGRKKSNGPDASALASRTGAIVSINPDSSHQFYTKVDSELGEIMRRFLLIERFGDTLVLAGRHSMFHWDSDFFDDAQKLIEVFSEHRSPIDLFSEGGRSVA